jgi:hypothetical protein
MPTIDKALADTFAPERALLPEGKTIKVYRAEDLAALRLPAAELDGTLEAAQAYADKVTRSAHWKRNCQLRLGVDGQRHTPTKVHVTRSRGEGSWAGGLYTVRGRTYPRVHLGTKRGRLPGGVARPPHIADPWVILHELAHIATPGDPGHGREFARVFLGLVRRFLGPESGKVLLAAYRAEQVKYLARRSA